jgi:hypothetical protein
VERPSLAKIDLVEIKRVRLSLGSERRKKMGAQNEAQVVYVIENTCRKNVDLLV